MGKAWDGGDIAKRPELWAEVLRVLKPGAYLLAFGGTRTYHRMACAIEDAGFEIRDCIQWLYGSGFPKSLDVSKAIDREIGPCAPEAVWWNGWGTAVKPAVELICVARKPLSERTVAANMLRHGTGAINIDGCRVKAEVAGRPLRMARRNKESDDARNVYSRGLSGSVAIGSTDAARWPANVIHDGSDEVMEAFAPFPAPGQGGRVTGNEPTANGFSGAVNFSGMRARVGSAEPRGDSGSPARFFYSAKADASDRLGSKHPTVKPVDLMRYLVRLVTPPGGKVLDPFAGSGTTGMAALAEGFDATLIERENEYVADIRRRIAHVSGNDTPLFSKAES